MFLDSVMRIVDFIDYGGLFVGNIADKIGRAHV